MPCFRGNGPAWRHHSFHVQSDDLQSGRGGDLPLDPGAEGKLSAGEVGYIISGVKTVSDTRIGDTITLDRHPAPAPLPGFKDVKPVVFSSLYPISSEDYQSLSDPWKSTSSTMRPLFIKRTPLSPWDWVFAAAFLDCFTLKSFRSVLKGNTIRPSS